MKRLACLVVLLASSTSFAAIKINSFSRVQAGSPLAELCGTVENPVNSPIYIRVVSDPTTKRPGVYNTVAGDDGNFCLTLLTYSNRAEVSLMNQTQAVEALLK